MPATPPLLRLALVAALLAAPPVRAADMAGPYLAARAATLVNDYAAGMEYYDRLLVVDPKNRDVQEGALITHIATADYDRAAALANAMLEEPKPSQIAVLVALAQDARAKDFAKGLALLDQGGDAGQLVGGLYRGWAKVGEGQMAEAEKAFEKVAKLRGLEGFAAYHRGLALAMVGDYEGADKIFSGKQAQVVQGTRRGLLAHLQVLSQLERDKDALKLLQDTFGADLDPEMAALRARLEKGEAVPFTVIRSATDGVAEIYYAVSQVLSAESPSAVGLVHAQLALWLRPDLGDAALLVGSVMEGQGQYDLAIKTFAGIAPDSPVYPATQLGMSEAMVAAGRTDEAVDVLQKLTRSHPELRAVWVALGDSLRRQERWKDSAEAYDKAVALIGTPGPGDWFIYFARGIAESRSDQWPKAEADFREALKLSPDQPSVLNYLGYSYVERKENLDEALSMIERAVAARPEDGAIVDSLGWALFRLGRYPEAVAQMEKAVELDPGEPLLNDHLGDVYWAVGRKREAEFQWHRALNFGPGEDLDMDRVRRKLEVGLDQVLKDEGAEPLHAAD
ncbi:tetratricopeptide repeat protein [Paenirhodobacter sp.]|uniref:tetratricopeptide repeat protein n=1 Tax=Paenirhodobacter sp. TaxID=1965326 RepID=UPI003B3D9CA8